MKKITSLLFSALMLMASAVSAQTDVTSKYIENPDFGARFAAWSNPGSFNYNVASNFGLKSGDVYMEKWVSSGNTLGTNSGMSQTLRDLPSGTYTLVVSAQNIQQSATSRVCKGAYIFAGNEQVEFNESKDYSVVFTVANGKANIGVKLTSCNGNWVAVDNFRLYYNGVNEDSLAAEQTRVDNEVQDLKDKIANATGTIPTVKTGSYVATGITIALGRSTISGSYKESGFCWSTEPNPTIFDEKTSETFDNNGKIYVMRGLKPSTIYYVRAYAITSGYQVAYGDVVKIGTLRKGVMAYGYDFAGDANQNARINSACAECIWMYNQLSYIPGFYLNVHYVYGAGAGDGTADCSYGGWMRVSQKEAYQQTGTILHETNHGVGVGTTNEWYNNANLRGSVTRGLWLGPRATQMVRFFDNNTTSTMTGDGTHMWPYGINGAQEDQYQPSNHALYFANILITHAMHQDGLICSGQAGFAMPAYVFQQDDNKKYYIKCEDPDKGGSTAYFGLSGTTLRSYVKTLEEATQDDKFAWNVTFDPTTSLYIFRNVGTGRYLTYNSTSITTTTRTTNPTANDKFMLMPCREDIKSGSKSFTSYWILSGSAHKALESNSMSTTYCTIKTSDFNAANSAKAQRWLILSEEDVASYDQAALNAKVDELKKLLDNVKAVKATPHEASEGAEDVALTDAALEGVISDIESRLDSYTSASEVSADTKSLETALVSFLAAVRVSAMEEPFDITFALVNPTIATSTEGWSQTATVSFGCAEYFQKTADFNQTTKIKFPKGTYKLKVQAFQRPKGYTDAYNDFKAGTETISAVMYLGTSTNTAKIKSIFADAQKSKVISADVTPASGVNIPNNMEGASKYFAKGLYDNEILRQTTLAAGATLPVGIKVTTSATGSWTIFSNFRLYSYGGWSQEIVTGLDILAPEENEDSESIIYDLNGRIVKNPSHGIYIRNGKKFMVE